MTGADDWSDVQEALAELTLIAQLGRMRSVERCLVALTAALTTGAHSTFATRAASGDLWGHMGSVFDSGTGDRQLDRRYHEAQIHFAEALASHGVSSRDIDHHFGRGETQVHWPSED